MNGEPSGNFSVVLCSLGLWYQGECLKSGHYLVSSLFLLLNRLCLSLMSNLRESTQIRFRDYLGDFGLLSFTLKGLGLLRLSLLSVDRLLSDRLFSMVSGFLSDPPLAGWLLAPVGSWS